MARAASLPPTLALALPTSYKPAWRRPWHERLHSGPSPPQPAHLALSSSPGALYAWSVPDQWLTGQHYVLYLPLDSWSDRPSNLRHPDRRGPGYLQSLDTGGPSGGSCPGAGGD